MSTVSPQGRADPQPLIEGVDAKLDDTIKRKVEQLIEEDEGATNRVGGWTGWLITLIACGTSLFHLYAAYDVVPADVLRVVHVGLVLFLAFLLFPMFKGMRDKVNLWDWIPALASLAVTGYVLWQGSEFGDRAILPLQRDIIVGSILIILLLEATRRTTGWIMPVVAICFLLYAVYGNYLPAPWTHKGYPLERLVAHLYMTLEGIFGTTVDVSATLILLFTIYGAMLQSSGAGKFFIDFSFAAMGGRRNSAGRAVVLSSFLMGGPSGSGVATTVTIGTVAYPLLAKAGYEKNAAGGLLAAGGLGAIISPPVLGAAAFLIAEFLKISYFDVILMACIPTVLYYFAIYVMVEIDSSKHGGGGEAMVAKGALWQLTKRYWFHFTSLMSIIVFMLIGLSPTLSVFWATVLAIAASVIRSDTSIIPRAAALPLLLSIALVCAEFAGVRFPSQSAITSAIVFLTLGGLLLQGIFAPKLAPVTAKYVAAMKEGTTGVLNVATTCATAGIIVGVVTLTGLAQRFADIIISYAQGSLVLTTLFTAAIVWIVGLAVPVTASYIMCAVIAAPALIKLGVPDFAAHMFIFYYAVLSEVSPPTALSPFAAAAITGGNPYKTTLQSWKYTMPAFLVPFVFVLDPMGISLLLKAPKGASLFDMVEIVLVTAIGIVALAYAFQGWVWRKNSWLEAGLFGAAGMLLTLPAVLQAIVKPLLGINLETAVPGLGGTGIHIALHVVAGLACLAAGLGLQRARHKLAA